MVPHLVPEDAPSEPPAEQSATTAQPRTESLRGEPSQGPHSLPAVARAPPSEDPRRGRQANIEDDRTTDHFEEREGYFV